MSERNEITVGHINMAHWLSNSVTVWSIHNTDERKSITLCHDAQTLKTQCNQYTTENLIGLISGVIIAK